MEGMARQGKTMQGKANILKDYSFEIFEHDVPRTSYHNVDVAMIPDELRGRCTPMLFDTELTAIQS
jgi:hypothetical protein